MRFCPKCGELYVDQLLAFCLADGTPLGVVTPDSDVWKEGSRLLEQKQNALKARQRKLKWRRVMLTAMLMATVVVSIASISRSIYVTVEPARGQLCITTFNDLNGNGLQDTSEPALSGFQVEVRGTDLTQTLTTDVNGSICSDLPVGTYTIFEQPRDGLIATTQTVTLTANQTAKLLFGGRHETGTIRVAKFDDLNRNGVQDPGEPGVSGIVLQVSGANLTTTLTTGPDGMASVVVPLGTYTVVEQPQDGTTLITQTVTVTEGHTADLSFAIGKARGKLCLKTFDDSNGNRVRDAGEPGLSAFVFQVIATGAATLLMTDSDGMVCSDMPVGKYTVVEQPQGGWIATTPKSQTITVNADQTATALFGSRRQRGNLCITAFNDLNGDGAKDVNEPSLPGFVFQVRGADAAKMLPTDIKGIGCSDVAIGTYIVVEQPQGGWIATTPTTKTIIVTADRDANVFFGLRQERGKLCITAFEDSNGNHVRDASEPGLPGLFFQVTGTGVTTTLTTDSQGGICSELAAGNYTVIRQLQRSWNATTDTKLTVTVTAGQKTNVVFGSRQEIKQERGTLCIAAFNDRNANHKQDAGEAGLPGLDFRVSGTGTTTTLTTDSQGVICSELSAGKYTVIEQPQRGWSATTDTKRSVTVTVGQKTNAVFGSRQELKQERGTLCIAAFNDLNGNHAHEANEPGLFGFVFLVSGTESTTLRTDRNGTACADLPLGTYTVMETPQPGWNPTTATKQTVILTSNRAAPFFFGNMKSNSDCLEADKSRDRQLILNQYERNWRNSIERQRERVIAAAAPQAHGKVRATLERFEPQVVLRTCATAFITLSYVWKVEVLGGAEKPRTERVNGHQNLACEKAGGAWICREPISR